MMKPGLYEQIISQSLSGELASVAEPLKAIEQLDNAEASQPWGTCRLESTYVYCQYDALNMSYEILHNSGNQVCIVYDEQDTISAMAHRLCQQETGKTKQDNGTYFYP